MSTTKTQENIERFLSAAHAHALERELPWLAADGTAFVEELLDNRVTGSAQRVTCGDGKPALVAIDAGLTVYRITDDAALEALAFGRVVGCLSEVHELEPAGIAEMTFLSEALAPIGGSFRIGPVSAIEATHARDVLPPRCWQ